MKVLVELQVRSMVRMLKKAWQMRGNANRGEDSKITD